MNAKHSTIYINLCLLKLYILEILLLNKSKVVNFFTYHNDKREYMNKKNYLCSVTTTVSEKIFQLWIFSDFLINEDKKTHDCEISQLYYYLTNS